MSSINVHSISSLEELDTSIGRFAFALKSAIEHAKRQIQKKSELLEGIVAARRRAVAALASACEDADDEEDTSVLRHKLDEAEEALAEARKWQRRVEEVCSGYERYASQASELAGEHAGKSRLFLKSRIAELHNYVSYKPHFSGGSAGSTSGGSGVSTETLNTRLALPAGYRWINFSELRSDQVEELPAEDEYRKGLSLSEMQEGLKLLQTRVLPEIQNNPAAANIEHFMAIDLKEKRMPPHSLADIFSVYFGNDYIRVSRPLNDQSFIIENGRHRIKAARELGWDAVPGRVIGVARPAGVSEGS
jgi:hypothetical protein